MRSIFLFTFPCRYQINNRKRKDSAANTYLLFRSVLDRFSILMHRLCVRRIQWGEKMFPLGLAPEGELVMRSLGRVIDLNAFLDFLHAGMDSALSACEAEGSRNGRSFYILRRSVYISASRQQAFEGERLLKYHMAITTPIYMKQI